MTSRRLLVLVIPFVLLLDQPCRATTAASLSDRITIDGDLSDWAADEWVLDASSTLIEFPDDSQWGTSEEILRVGVTWDAEFLYLAVEFRAQSGSVLAALGYSPGGLSTLDGAGTFRRAIDFPFAANIMMLASTRDEPAIARVDDHNVLALLDRATAPAVVRAPLEGAAGFEAALPWSMLSFARPLQLTVALTGGEGGTGAGDAAPNPSVQIQESGGPGSKTRVSLDRWLAIAADGDADGTADAGIAPRTAVVVQPDSAFTTARTDGVKASMVATPRVFAPDRGEDAAFTVDFDRSIDEVFITARVYSVDGRLVRVLYQDILRAIASGVLVTSPQDRWDGRDADGRVVAGGVYVLSFEWGLVRGERAGRATAGVAVAR